MEKETGNPVNYRLLRDKALYNFKESDISHDDSGLYPNTVERSASTALDSILEEHLLSATDLYSMISREESLPHLHKFRGQYSLHDADEMNKFAHRLLTHVVKKDLKGNVEGLNDEETYRVRNFRGYDRINR